MDGFLTDTSPDAERVLIAGLRRMSPARRIQLANEMTRACRELSLAGLRTRYPGASEVEIRRRLAALWLDRDTVRLVYGWDPEVEGY